MAQVILPNGRILHHPSHPILPHTFEFMESAGFIPILRIIQGCVGLAKSHPHNMHVEMPLTFGSLDRYRGVDTCNGDVVNNILGKLWCVCCRNKICTLNERRGKVSQCLGCGVAYDLPGEFSIRSVFSC